MIPRPLVAVASLAAVVLLAASAAALEVSVQGTSELDVTAHTAGNTVQVHTRLFDDLGDPIGGEALELVVQRDGEPVVRQRVHTDFYGVATPVLELPEGDYELLVDYGGNSHLSASRDQQSIEVRSAPVQLELDAPGWVHGEPPEIPVQLRATAGAEGLPATVRLSADDRLVKTVRLDSDGHRVVDLSEVLQPGDHRLSARIEPSEYREGASAHQNLRVVDAPRLDGEVERVFQRTRRGRRVEVRLKDDHGPIPGVGVQIRLEHRDDGRAPLIERAATDEQGVAEAMFADEQLEGQQWTVSARATPPVGEAVVWEGERLDAETIDWLRLFAPVAAVVLIAALAWFGRHRLDAWWRQLRARLAAGRPPKNDQPRTDSTQLEPVEKLAVTPVDVEPPPHPDRSEAPPAIQLWDEWTDEPVVQGRVRATWKQDGHSEADSDERGIVLLDAPRGEKLQLRVFAEGFVPATTTVCLDEHTGTMRLALTPVPLKIRRAFRSVVRHTRGDDPWGRLTPRQIGRALRQMHEVSPPAGDESPGEHRPPWRQVFEQWETADDEHRLAMLTRAVAAAVEETSYSGRNYDNEVWERTRTALNELLRRLESHPGGDE